jgi:hypothetical protein
MLTMKKIITLLFAVGAVSASFAQSSRKIEENREVINGTGGNRKVYDENGTRYPSSTGTNSREEQINTINRQYDRRINAVRMNPTLSAAEKERRISELEYERQRRIQEINNGSYSGDRRNRDYDKNKTYKKDNGKHLGWEKGVGNPHRSDGGNRGNGNGNGKGKGKKG